MTILIDLDGIVVDLLPTWLKAYNEDYDDKLTIADVKSWDVHEHVKAECGRKIYDYFECDDRVRFHDLPPVVGAVEAIKELMTVHEVVICTASAKSPHTAAEKLIWVRKHLGLDRKHVFIGHKKHMIKADVFIDDSPHNLRDYRLAWKGQAEILTIAYPYNASVGHLCRRFYSWEEPWAAWQSILNYIGGLNGQATA